MRKRNALIIGSIILLAGILLGAGILYHWLNRRGDTDAGSGISLDKSAVSLSQDGEEDTQEALSIRFPGYPEITVEGEDREIPIVLTNPQNNPCYFKFHVSIQETGQTLATTDWVEPGNAISGIDLDQALEAGDYTLTIQVETKSLEDESPMNGGTVRTQLHVK